MKQFFSAFAILLFAASVTATPAAAAKKKATSAGQSNAPAARASAAQLREATLQCFKEHGAAYNASEKDGCSNMTTGI